MGNVTIQLPPVPAHVRTARLMAASMAKRAGVDEQLLDEIRLAVGEACARAVQVHILEGIAAPITIELADDDGFRVTITDRARATVPTTSSQVPDGRAPWGSPAAAPVIGLAILTAVVDDVLVTTGDPCGTKVRVSWPAAARA